MSDGLTFSEQRMCSVCRTWYPPQAFQRKAGTCRGCATGRRNALASRATAADRRIASAERRLRDEHDIADAERCQAAFAALSRNTAAAIAGEVA